MWLLRKSVFQLSALAAALLLAACSRGAGLGAALQPSGPPDAATLQAFLDSEFERLGIDPDKVAAQAPSGPSNAAFDLYAIVNDPDDTGPQPPASVFLSWTEQITGDCDQNGEVNSADLTPIGLRFNGLVQYDDPGQHGGFAQWPTGDRWDDGGPGPGSPADPASPAANWRSARIDTDHNGEINISDITALAVHWQERSDGYSVYRKLAGETTFTRLLNPGTPSLPYTWGRPSTIDPSRPVIFDFSDTDLGPAPAGLCEYYVVSYDAGSDTEGEPSPVITVDLDAGSGGTASPVAVLDPDPPQGAAPFSMTWHADGSYDPDGTIAKYEWDMDGDQSTWEYDSGTDPTLQLTYNAAGTFEQWVRVTDNDGRTAMAGATVSVSEPTGENQLPTVSFTATPGSGANSLKVDFDASASADPDGFIVLYEWDPEGDGSWPFDSGSTATAQHTYSQAGTYQAQLRVTDNRGGVATGTTEVTVEEPGPEWHVEDPAGTSNTIGDISIAIISGHPAVAWTDTDPGENKVHYRRATDALGTAWGPDRVIGNWVFNQSTIDIVLFEVSGQPGVAYFAPDNAYTGTLYFVLGNDADGNSFKTTVTVTNGVRVLLGLDGAMVGGVPALVYRDVGNGNFDFTRAIDGNGTVWGGAVHIDSSAGNPGYHCDLEIVDGKPAAIAANKYYRAATASGSDWTGPGSLNRTAGTGWMASLEVADDNPAIGFYTYNAPDQRLYYMRAVDNLGSTWTTGQIIDPPASERGDNYGNNCTLFLYGNLPYLAYENETSPGLYAIGAKDRAGTVWGESELIDSGFVYSTSSARGGSASFVAYTKIFGFRVAALYETTGIL